MIEIKETHHKRRYFADENSNVYVEIDNDWPKSPYDPFYKKQFENLKWASFVGVVFPKIINDNKEPLIFNSEMAMCGDDINKVIAKLPKKYSADKQALKDYFWVISFNDNRPQYYDTLMLAKSTAKELDNFTRDEDVTELGRKVSNQPLEIKGKLNLDPEDEIDAE